MLVFIIGIIILAVGSIIIWHYELKEKKTKIGEWINIIGWLAVIAGGVVTITNLPTTIEILRNTLKNAQIL